MDEEKRKRFWDSLCLADDAAFSIALGGNTECASFIVRTILDRRDITVSSVHTQRSQRKMDSHCSIFDMLAYDDEGNLYDVEMQRSSASGDEIGARASYYEAMLGTRALRKGEKYSELRERIVIFILEEDAIGEDRDVYEYEFRDEEGKALEGSRVRIVLANTACHGRMRPDLESLYRDLYEPVVEKIRNPELREGLERVKGSADMSRRQNNIVNEMIQEWVNEGIAEGEKKGEAKKQNLIIRNMLSANYPIKEIAAITDLSVDDVNRIAATLNL